MTVVQFPVRAAAEPTPFEVGQAQARQLHKNIDVLTAKIEKLGKSIKAHDAEWTRIFGLDLSQFPELYADRNASLEKLSRSMDELKAEYRKLFNQRKRARDILRGLALHFIQIADVPMIDHPDNHAIREGAFDVMVKTLTAPKDNVRRVG